MSAIHLKAELQHREGQHLLPKHLPMDFLICIARNMAQFKSGALDWQQKEEVWNLLAFWVGKILSSQDIARAALLQKHPEKLMKFLDKLCEVLCDELSSRLIEYPTYDLCLDGIFTTQFKGVGLSCEFAN
jgi:hypothetical protein